MSGEYSNVVRRLDKLKGNYTGLINEVNKLSGKNRQLHAVNKSLLRDFEGLISNPKIKEVLEEDKKEFEKFLETFQKEYSENP